MVGAIPKKPRRINVAALLNILVGIVGCSAIVLLAKDPDVIAKLPIDSWSIWISVALTIALVFSSVWALFGKRLSHQTMLVMAVLYYGALIYQNASFLKEAEQLFSQDGEVRIWSNIVRTSLELALTSWAVLSGKTRSYHSALSRAV